MTDKTVTTYVVSVFEKPFWRTVLTTKDKAKAEALAKRDWRQGADRGDYAEAEENGRRPLGGGGWGAWANEGAGLAER